MSSNELKFSTLCVTKESGKLQIHSYVWLAQRSGDAEKHNSE